MASIMGSLDYPTTYNAQTLGMNSNAGKTNADGSAVDPLFQTLLGADGQIISPYQIQAGQAPQLDQRAIDAIKQRATSSAPSAWANLQTSQLAAQRDQGLAGQMKLAQSYQAQGQDNLAMRGGLSQGAQSRLAQQAGLNQMLAKQRAGRDFDAGSQNIAIQDQQYRQDALSMLPSLAQTQYQADSANRDFESQRQQTNINNSLKDIAFRRNVDATAYQNAMKKWAAENTADATVQAGHQSSGGKK